MVKSLEVESRGLYAQGPPGLLMGNGDFLPCSSISLGLLLHSFSKVISKARAESTAGGCIGLT